MKRILLILIFFPAVLYLSSCEELFEKEIDINADISDDFNIRAIDTKVFIDTGTLDATNNIDIKNNLDKIKDYELKEAVFKITSLSTDPTTLNPIANGTISFSRKLGDPAVLTLTANNVNLRNLFQSQAETKINFTTEQGNLLLDIFKERNKAAAVWGGTVSDIKTLATVKIILRLKVKANVKF